MTRASVTIRAEIAMSYVSRVLQEGRTLATMLRSVCEREGVSRVDALAASPEDAREDQPLEWSRGISATQGDEALAETIAEWLRNDGALSCLFEDQESRRGDEWLTRNTGSRVLYGTDGTVFHVPKAASVDAIAAAIASTSAFPLVGVLFRGVIPDGDALNEQFITLVAESFRAFFVSVFDGETYLMVHRHAGRWHPADRQALHRPAAGAE